ncbi:IucA/IucC family protein [Streptomyces sp. NPDC020096]
MTTEDELTIRVLSALLREDVVGLRSRSAPVVRQDGRWLRLPAADGEALLLPVAEDGYQSEYAARLPLLRRETADRRTADLTSCDDILRALRALADPVDGPGFEEFAEEYRQTLATMRLHHDVRAGTHQRLAASYGPDPARWRGHRGALAHDSLAAYLDHPVYPTARGRRGLGAAELRSYAPEFHPRYRPRWVVLPREAVTTAGAPLEEVLPGRWPSPALLGLPELDRDHLALPVHPLTKAQPLQDALRSLGLERHAALARRPHLDLIPTLSMRTGAVADHPRIHLKLPLDTATLGVGNRRTIKPGTLADGAACQRLLEAVIAREPRFKDSVLLADETCWAHAGHQLLAVLVRVHPAGLDQSAIVPMAALLAPAPSGRLVIEHLADRFHDGDPLALLDAVLRLLFDWQTALFGYGIALESHQQNISLVFDAAEDGPRVRLLLKDNDGPRVNATRLGDLLEPVSFDDPRTVTDDDGPLADLFTTITVHLCAGAYAFGLARTGRAPLTAVLRLIRDRLAEAVDRLPPQPRDVLRERVLDAARLPVKAMVSAGTLFSKERCRAADINKHYTTGPNYLLGASPPGPGRPPGPAPGAL